jgi:ABC-type nitrate/sulfonate/bicarbonate transport system ATPase subunit
LNNKPNIILDNISKSFSDRQILKEVSLEVHSGKRTVLLGPSGSGKTTLLRIIAGLDKPDSGYITGISRKEIAFMFQEPRLFPWLSALENIACVIDKKRAVAREEAAAWLEKVRLNDDGGKYPSELSGGMNRRVSLARTLAYNKPVILLDEPFYGLDTALKNDIIKLVKSETEGRTVVFITHDTGEANAFADKIICLSEVNRLQAASQAPF